MILAAVSGGLDSVAMLYKLLIETDEEIHVHHISIRTIMNRWQAEDRAMNLIVPWLFENVRVFGITTSIVEKPKASDIVIVSHECAKIVRNLSIKMPSALARGANAHDMKSAGTGARQRAAAKKWQELLGSSAPEIVFPIAAMRRAALWESLPPDLRSLTTSCRRPTIKADEYRACRHCQTCKQLAAEGVPHDRELRAA